MPDKDGKLSPRDLETVAAHFRAKLPGGVICPMCKQAKTYIGSHVVVPSHYGEGAVNPQPPTVYPQIFLVCQVCSHMMFFSAVTMGLSLDNTYNALAGLPRLPGSGGAFG